MHRRLRRQLHQHLGHEPETAPELRRLLRDIDAEYQRADQDRSALQRALELLADLTRRPMASEARQAAPRKSPVTRMARGLFDHAPFAAFLCDGELELLAWNKAAERLFGYRPAEALGRSFPELVFPESDRASARREFRKLVERGEGDQSLRVASTRGGEARLDEWTVVPLRDREGRAAGAAVLVREPFSSPDRYTAAWQGTGDGLFDWDLRTDRVWLSDSFLALVGDPAATGLPADWLERIHTQDREAFQAALRAHLDGQTPAFESEHRLRHHDGEYRWVLARGRASRDATGKAVRFSGAAMDVTARRATADRALHDALHDPLTRLPNRALFLDLVKRSFARTRRRESYGFGVVFLDLDHFKAVNDGLGHAAGDELLVQMSRRLQTCLREGDTLARHGGDEFTILLDDVRGPIDAQIVADRIHQVTALPFEISGQELFVTTSIGIALSSPTYSRPEDLLLDADTAMYRSKALGRARTVVFDATTRERSPQLLDLEADLRRALLKEEFRVHYMPLVEMSSGRIQGLEALLRWAHPKRGLVPPDQFVPFAEETGLIVPIGRWMLRQAGRDFQACRRASSARSLALHVNLSSKQLLNADLMEQFEGVFKEQQLDPRDLAVELTEHTFQQGEQASHRIAELHNRGVRLCMDDFGTGYSSIASLHRFQLDTLKIDRSLFSGGAPRGKAPDLVRSIVSMAKEMGKPVVAEGIETAEQFQFLREVGCTAAQGFYFSPAVESEAARAMVADGASW
jgi:diguanylate cyclase (GGDEF)-like protein/PAS domain S-box-containing protein